MKQAQARPPVTNGAVAQGATALVGLGWIDQALREQAPSLAGAISDVRDARLEQVERDYAALDQYCDVQAARIGELSDECAALALENAALRGGPVCVHAPYYFGDERLMCVLGPEMDRLRADGERVVLRPIVHRGETIGLELCTVVMEMATTDGED